MGRGTDSSTNWASSSGRMWGSAECPVRRYELLINIGQLYANSKQEIWIEGEDVDNVSRRRI